MNQLEFVAITRKLLEAWRKLRLQAAIGFGFASRCYKNWCENFKPTTMQNNHNRVITFNSHLKTPFKSL